MELLSETKQRVGADGMDNTLVARELAPLRYVRGSSVRAGREVVKRADWLCIRQPRHQSVEERSAAVGQHQARRHARATGCVVERKK